MLDTLELCICFEAEHLKIGTPGCAQMTESSQSTIFMIRRYESRVASDQEVRGNKVGITYVVSSTQETRHHEVLIGMIFTLHNQTGCVDAELPSGSCRKPNLHLVLFRRQ